jgi:hypothetical protein
MRLVSSTPLRHPDALERSAGKSFTHYSEWLAGRELVGQCYPLFAAELQACINEADLLLAMLATAERDRGIYCEPLNRETVERVRVRLIDPQQRRQTAILFSTSEAELDETLERLYGGLTTNERRIDQPPARLLAPSDDD